MLDCQPLALGYEALENPVMSSFHANWRGIADRVGTAYALPETMGPFAAMSEGADAAHRDFVTLVEARKSPVLVVHQRQITVPQGLQELHQLRGVQMVPTGTLCAEQATHFDALDEADGPEMVRLARMAKPGPFAVKTHQLGDFIGLRVNGELVAMAGQRMGFAGWVEISAVCVHPDFRKRGFARQLVTAMVGKILRSGATPFLHTFADNFNAITLYRSLGFEIRTDMHISQMASSR